MIEDNNIGVWSVTPMEDLKWIEQDGFRLLVCSSGTKELENFPVKESVGYRFEPIPFITDGSWFLDPKILVGIEVGVSDDKKKEEDESFEAAEKFK